jgi:hypothetical protein
MVWLIWLAGNFVRARRAAMWARDPKVSLCLVLSQVCLCYFRAAGARARDYTGKYSLRRKIQSKHAVNFLWLAACNFKLDLSGSGERRARRTQPELLQRRICTQSKFAYTPERFAPRAHFPKHYICMRIRAIQYAPYTRNNPQPL